MLITNKVFPRPGVPNLGVMAVRGVTGSLNDPVNEKVWDSGCVDIGQIFIGQIISITLERSFYYGILYCYIVI